MERWMERWHYEAEEGNQRFYMAVVRAQNHVCGSLQGVLFAGESAKDFYTDITKEEKTRGID